jgi:hypothetical protein
VVVVVTVIVRVSILCRAYIVHLVHGTALHATRLRLLAGEGDPDNVVRVSGATSATNILLVAGRVDCDRVLHRACNESASRHCFPGALVCLLLFGIGLRSTRTDTASIQWPHIEDVDTLHLSENFETLKTSGLFGIRGNSTRLSTWGKKVGLGLDF